MMSDAETKDMKAAVLELVDDLPSDATWEDVMYRVYVREAIEAGRRDAAEGRVVDLAEVRRRFGLAE
jgi:predicted transcriptional regulator